MNKNIEEIIDRIHALEEELREHLKETEAFFSVEHGRIVFSQEQIQSQKRQVQNLLTYLFTTPLRHIVTAPFIYILIVPILMLDLFVSLYQVLCFPAYRIPKVKRKAYIVLDRHKLQHLNLIEKLNCLYCGYVNGLIGYVREIAARTELYWCPIKHARHGKDAHYYYYRFSSYGEYEGLKKRWEAQRTWLKEVEKRSAQKRKSPEH